MATRTISNAGGNWNASGAWVEGAVPTSADDVVATATSGPLTCTTSSAAKTLILTGYANTLTINTSQVLTVSGDVTLASGMTYAGAGTLIINATATLTANSKTVSGALTLGSAVTYTLADNWVVNGLLTTGTTTASTINGNQITINAGWTCVRTAGTTAFILAGTGTWTGSNSLARYCSNPVTINTAGTITLAAVGPNFSGNTVTYTAGTLAVSGSAVYLSSGGGGTTFAGTWPTLDTLSTSLTGTSGDTPTLTIGAALTVTTLLVPRAGTLTLAGAYGVTTGTLQVQSGATLKLSNSQTLTVSTAMTVSGTYHETTTISSTTASTSSTLTYNGTQANMKIAWCAFTDVTATNPLWDHWGGTLTRTSGITNTSYTPGDYSDPGEAQVAIGTSYLYQGATKNGSYAGGSGGLMTHPGMAGGARG